MNQFPLPSTRVLPCKVCGCDVTFNASYPITEITCNQCHAALKNDKNVWSVHANAGWPNWPPEGVLVLETTGKHWGSRLFVDLLSTTGPRSVWLSLSRSVAPSYVAGDRSPSRPILQPSTKPSQPATVPVWFGTNIENRRNTHAAGTERCTLRRQAWLTTVALPQTLVRKVAPISSLRHHVLMLSWWAQMLILHCCTITKCLSTSPPNHQTRKPDQSR